MSEDIMTGQAKRGWKEDGKSVRGKMIVLFLGPLLLGILGAGLYLFGGRYVSTDNAYFKAEKTSISAEVSGKIIQVNVKDNARVEKGAVLLQIDPEPFRIAVERAQANLGTVRAEIESLRADYQQKLALLDRSEEEVRYRSSEYNRYKALAEKMVASGEKSDLVRYDYNAALKQRDADLQDVEAARAKLGGNPDMPVEDQSAYQQAAAELEKARLDLARVEVKAPADGVAANVSAEPGEYVAAGLPLFSLVNDHAVWIEANFKETELTYVRPGQPAEVEVDTYPGLKWQAKVVSVTPATASEFSILPAQNSSGNWVKVVQRIMVRLELADNDGRVPLAAGMSAVVTVDTGENRLKRRLNRSGAR